MPRALLADDRADTATAAPWSNCFVRVVQLSEKTPALHAIAPGTPPAGPVFGAVRGLVPVGVIVAGYPGIRRFHPGV